MPMEFNFGFAAKGKGAASAPAAGAPFRIALLGDFSGAANKGRLDTGDALAARKPLRVDVDNIEKIFTRLGPKLSLPLGEDGAGVEIPLGSIEDFHPDQLYENVELFSAVADLRNRVRSKSQFPAAAREVYGWLGRDVPKLPRRPVRARGTSLPKNARLSDFAELVGRPSASSEEASIDTLVQSIVRPYLQPAKDPRQDEVLKIVDQALSDAMRRVLHHPDFQTLEAIWRSVDLLTRRVETTSKLQLVLYDVTVEELAADLASAEALEDTGLYKLLVEQPKLDESQGALSVLLGFYNFELTPPQAELLGRVAALAATARAPFIAGVSLDALIQDEDEIHPLVRQSWDALRALPDAQYLALALPRFLLRQPYGEKSDPIDSFDFEEFTRRTGLSGMLWGNPAAIAGVLLGEGYSRKGLKLDLGGTLSVDDMPYFFYRDEDDDVTALPCTERLMTERLITWVRRQNLIPVISIKGRPEVRFGGFTSLSGERLAGPWGEAKRAAPASKSAEPEAAEERAEEAETADPEAAALNAEPEEAASDAADDDLDALLKSLEDPEPAAEESADATAASDDDMDPELAELLKGL